MLSKLPKHESEIPRKGAVDFAANLRKLVEYQQNLVDQLNSNVDAYNKLAKEVSEVEVNKNNEQFESLASSIRKINGKLSNIKNYDDSAVIKRIKVLESAPKVDLDPINSAIKKLSSKPDYDDSDIKARLAKLEKVEKYDDAELKSLVETYQKRAKSEVDTYHQLLEAEIKKRDAVIDELAKSVESMAGQISELQSVIMGETE